MRVSSLGAYWTRAHVVIGSNSGHVNLFVLFHAATMFIFYITMTKLCIFQKSKTVRNYITLF
jgi:hypothetical protein